MSSLEIESNSWESLLINGAKILGVSITSSEVSSMRMHATELLKWNKVTNLTSIIDPLEIAVKHFLDSIAVVPFIPKYARVLDIGTGAGFPSIPIKIILPCTFLTMVDSSRKKNSFLKHIIRTLDLKKISTVHARCEDIYNLDIYKGSFDIVICRAFTSLGNFIKLAEPFLSKDAIIIALKGKMDDSVNEIDGIDINSNFVISNKVFHMNKHSYLLPIMESNRNLIFIKSVKNTY